jgi:hypothetical protein
MIQSTNKTIIKKVIKHIRKETMKWNKDLKYCLYMILNDYKNNDVNELDIFIYAISNYKIYYSEFEKMFLPDIKIKRVRLVM